jgi:hypothetical protein
MSRPCEVSPLYPACVYIQYCTQKTLEKAASKLENSIKIGGYQRSLARFAAAYRAIEWQS